MPDNAEVAACRNFTENKMDKLSQKATYKILTSIKKIIRENSSTVGGMPMKIRPNPVTKNPRVKKRILMTISAAVNLALIQ